VKREAEILEADAVTAHDAAQTAAHATPLHP